MLNRPQVKAGVFENQRCSHARTIKYLRVSNKELIYTPKTFLA